MYLKSVKYCTAKMYNTTYILLFYYYYNKYIFILSTVYYYKYEFTYNFTIEMFTFMFFDICLLIMIINKVKVFRNGFIFYLVVIHKL